MGTRSWTSASLSENPEQSDSHGHGIKLQAKPHHHLRGKGGLVGGLLHVHINQEIQQLLDVAGCCGLVISNSPKVVDVAK